VVQQIVLIILLYVQGHNFMVIPDLITLHHTYQNAANSVIRYICKKDFQTKKIFSSLHLKVLFLFMLTGWRSMSQMLFRGNLDFARCLCDRDHNGYLSHFWADASTLEAIHSWMVPVCNQCKNCCQADNGFEESQGSLALAIGIWRIEIWVEHIQHIIMCIMVLFICCWPTQNISYSEAWLELRSFSFSDYYCLPWTDRGLCPMSLKEMAREFHLGDQSKKHKQTRHWEFCKDVSFRQVSIELIR